MGARHQGDIAYLANIAKPSIGLVLSVGKAHLGEFGSREVIAATKSELIQSLPKDGFAILGSYDELTPHMADNLEINKVSFGEKSTCQVRAADIEVREGRAHFDLVTKDGRAPVSLQLLGLHQISNALGAAAVATVVGVPLEVIAAALSTAEVSSKWRMEIIEEDDLLLINDSYNANPESMAAALRTLALIAQERGGLSWAFLGKMHELGASSTAEHQEIGRLVTEIGIDHLVSVGTEDYLTGITQGELTEGETQLHYFSTRDEALSMVENFTRGDVVLVKASRAEELNLLTDALINSWKGVEK
jgi:UDP-N-acetylmuramoyl-tripeptide--D-alanyl-D-alanine ligase